MRSLPIAVALGVTLTALPAQMSTVSYAKPRAAVLPSATDNIVTVAGTKAELGDGGPATSALLNSPGTVTCYTDRAGAHSCFIVEAVGNRIRRVDPYGAITTFAGTGGTGFNGDGIPASQAQLNSPRGLLVHGEDLYIVEFAGHRVRKVNLEDGAPIITTVAGTGVPGSQGDFGPATAAQLNGPGFVAFDSSGNLYISEVSGLQIRKVDTNGIISKIAGTGSPGNYGDNGVPALSAQFVAPNGIDIDAAAGALYVADTNNGCVRKIDLAATEPTIETVAGHCGFNGISPDGVLARDAKLNGPRSVSVDSAGTLYIAEFANHKIRAIDEAGILRTVAGTGEKGYSGDLHLAIEAKLNGPNFAFFDADGSFYIAEPLGQHIRKVDPSGIITTFAGGGIPALGDGGPATAGQFFPAESVAFDSAGNFYIADLANNRVRKVTRATGLITTFAGTGVAGFLGDDGPATAAQLSFPAAVAVDPAGNVYIADSTSRRIRKVDTDGVITRFAGTGVSGSLGDGGPAVNAQVFNPNGLAVDCVGNLYISELGGHKVRKVDAQTLKISLVAGSGFVGFGGDGGPATAPEAKLDAPVGIAADCAGNVYIADTGNSRIRRVDAVTHVITTVAGNGVNGFGADGVLAKETPLNFPTDVEIDAAGNLLIADAGNNRIRTVDGQGIIRTIAGSGVFGFTGDGGSATGARLGGPRGVALDSAGNVYTTDAVNTRVRRLNLAATVYADPRHFDLALGRWVWMHVQLPAGWDARQVNLDSVVLQAIDPANGALRLSTGNQVLQTATKVEPEGLRDTDGDGVPDHLILKFERATVASWTAGVSQLVLRVEGQFEPPAGSPIGTYFSGDTSL